MCTRDFGKMKSLTSHILLFVGEVRKTNTLLAENFENFGQISDKNFAHFDVSN